MFEKFQIRNSLIQNRIYLVKNVSEKKGYAVVNDDQKKDITEECKKAMMCWLDQETENTENKDGIIIECAAGTLTWERKKKDVVTT